MRGMYVAPRHRRLGIGRLLLTALQPHLPPEPCYCLPFSHLGDFYGEVGFEQVAHTELPMHLRQRAEGYLDRGLDIIAMRRGPSEVH